MVGTSCCETVLQLQALWALFVCIKLLKKNQKQNNVDILKYSDLNPIENLWQELKVTAYLYAQKSHKLDQLEQIAKNGP